jgi:hypothetical protein
LIAVHHRLVSQTLAQDWFSLVSGTLIWPIIRTMLLSYTTDEMERLA